MPGDSRRLQGPENTSSYTLYIYNNRTYHDLVDKLTTDEKRKDGRKFNDQRRICKKTEPSLWSVY
jgi:hypothetical protein